MKRRQQAAAIVVAMLSTIALAGCSKDEPKAEVIDTTVIESEESVAADPFADLPRVEFSNLEDCRGELTDVDVRPVFAKASESTGTYDFVPAWTGDVCEWQWGATYVQVTTGDPAEATIIATTYALTDGLTNGTRLADTTGFSAGWIDSDGAIRFLALAEDGRAFTCGFSQLDPSEENGDISVDTATIAPDVKAACAAVLSKLQGAIS